MIARIAFGITIFVACCIAQPASASWFSGWKPFKKPLEPVQKASDALTGVKHEESTAKSQIANQPSTQAVQDAAKKSIDDFAQQVKKLIEERKQLEEDLRYSDRRESIFSIGTLTFLVTTVFGVYKAFTDRQVARATLAKLEVEKGKETELES